MGPRLPLNDHELKKAGLKITLPRLKILQIFEGAGTRHVTAEDIYKKLIEAGEDVGLATVYRVLTQFQAAGLLTRHHFEGGSSVFELNEGIHHDHLVCIRCGRIEEFVDNVIEKRQKAVAHKHGFDITDHCMYLYGICGKCKEKG